MTESLLRVKQAEQRLWLPGHGVVDKTISACIRAVESYDESLVLGRHELTGDWCVFLKRGPYGDPFPVIGLGQQLPSPEEITQRLVKSDTKRNGTRLLDEITSQNERRRKELDDRSSEAAGMTAEAFEWGHRRMGSHPSPRIFVPAGI